jgi:hypothetical protein
MPDSVYEALCFLPNPNDSGLQKDEGGNIVHSGNILESTYLKIVKELHGSTVHVERNGIHADLYVSKPCISA